MLYLMRKIVRYILLNSFNCILFLLRIVFLFLTYVTYHLSGRRGEEMSEFSSVYSLSCLMRGLILTLLAVLICAVFVFVNK